MTEQQLGLDAEAEREASALATAANEQRSVFMCLEEHVEHEDDPSYVVLGVARIF